MSLSGTRLTLALLTFSVAVEDGKISVKKVETGYEFKTERVVPKVG